MRARTWVALVAWTALCVGVGYGLGAQAVAVECNVWIHEVRDNIHELKSLFDKHREAAH